jgi:hypothetical protein
MCKRKALLQNRTRTGMNFVLWSKFVKYKLTPQSSCHHILVMHSIQSITKSSVRGTPSWTPQVNRTQCSSGRDPLKWAITHFPCKQSLCHYWFLCRKQWGWIECITFTALQWSRQDLWTYFCVPLHRQGAINSSSPERKITHCQSHKFIHLLENHTCHPSP